LSPSPTGSLAGTVSLVTGGSSGIGLAMAGALLRAGAGVAVCSRRPEVPALVAGFPGRVLPVRCDVTDPAAIHAAVAATIEAFGRLDSCFAAAGVNSRQPLLATTIDDFRRTLDVNFTGAFLVLQAAARAMTTGGSLVAVSSIAGVRGQATTADYAASKAALRALVFTAATELAGCGIRANVMTPGYVHTPLLDPYLGNARFVSAVTARVPLGRMAHPHELGPLAVHLAGPGAVTGTEFVIDGGWLVA
jgi:NAD(P)-dependent dehydrogenase (short-subunit alcohol dehydrogenase family)